MFQLCQEATTCVNDGGFDGSISCKFESAAYPAFTFSRSTMETLEECEICSKL